MAELSGKCLKNLTLGNDKYSSTKDISVFVETVTDEKTSGKTTEDQVKKIVSSEISNLVDNDTITASSGKISLSKITSSILNKSDLSATGSSFGLIKTGYPTEGNNYGVMLDGGGKAYVQVNGYTSGDDTINITNDKKITVGSLSSKISDLTSDTDDSRALATKQFVNSSIQTNTATFRGTFQELSDLEGINARQNDYAFVVSAYGEDPEYTRYKCTLTSYGQTDLSDWAFEYRLNNSSFTSEQWNSINSKITKDNVTTLTSNSDNWTAAYDKVKGIQFGNLASCDIDGSTLTVDGGTLKVNQITTANVSDFKTQVSSEIGSYQISSDGDYFTFGSKKAMKMRATFETGEGEFEFYVFGN